MLLGFFLFVFPLYSPYSEGELFLEVICAWAIRRILCIRLKIKRFAQMINYLLFSYFFFSSCSFFIIAPTNLSASF